MRRRCLGLVLLLVSCYQFEFPQHFIELPPRPDGGSVLPDGQTPDESYTSCPLMSVGALGDGGVVPRFDSVTLDLATSIGLVGFPSAIPVGCVEPMTAVARLGKTPVAPQPRFGFSSSNASVLTVDERGQVTGVNPGVVVVDLDAGVPFSAARQVWVGGDATLSLTPGTSYAGFTTPLHATATAGTITGPMGNSNITAHFSMRQGTGLDAVERSLVLQFIGADLELGQTPLANITYREFGERLPNRVRDFTTKQDVALESVSNRTVRFGFTALELTGANGSVKITGHLEFTAP